MVDALRAAPPLPFAGPARTVLEARGLSVTAGRRTILRDVHLEIGQGQVLAIVGPSGAGKTTLLRCLNRLVDLEPDLAVAGEVRFQGRSIFASGVDADHLREKIGMLFQQPVIFPKSIYRNVLFGVRHLRRHPRRAWPELAERVLREVALWDEVRDRLGDPAASLSVGQQQRLCLARTLAVEPEVILMDEPTSALDPRSAAAVEELILSLKARCTLVLVTHNLAQARRLADRLACVLVRDGAGEVAACASAERLFSDPGSREVFEYLNQESR